MVARRFGWDPFGEMRDMRDRMDELFRGIEEGFSTTEPQRMFCDVVESDGEILVTADLPGVSKDDIDIRCTGDSLMIKAERRSEEEEKESEGYVRRERSWGSYRRDISLPGKVDCDAVEARFRNGVLKVKLPKEEAEGRRVTVD